MGLAGRKQKQRIPNDPRNLAWADDAAKFGQAYLTKLGWGAGSGLGASGDGRASALKVHQKLDMLGIGAGRVADGGEGNGKLGRDYEGLLRRLNSGPMDEDKQVPDGFVSAKQGKQEEEGIAVKTDMEIAAVAAPIAAPTPRHVAKPAHRSHRARHIMAKSLLSSSPAALDEILGISRSPSTSATAPASPAPDALTPTGASDGPLEKLTTSTLSVADYFRTKMQAKGVKRASPLASVAVENADETLRHGLGSDTAPSADGYNGPHRGLGCASAPSVDGFGAPPLGLGAAPAFTSSSALNADAPRLGLGSKLGLVVASPVAEVDSVPEPTAQLPKAKKSKKDTKGRAKEGQVPPPSDVGFADGIEKKDKTSNGTGEDLSEPGPSSSRLATEKKNKKAKVLTAEALPTPTESQLETLSAPLASTSAPADPSVLTTKEKKRKRSKADNPVDDAVPLVAKKRKRATTETQMDDEPLAQAPSSATADAAPSKEKGRKRRKDLGEAAEDTGVLSEPSKEKKRYRAKLDENIVEPTTPEVASPSPPAKEKRRKRASDVGAAASSCANDVSASLAEADGGEKAHRRAEKERRRARAERKAAAAS